MTDTAHTPTPWKIGAKDTIGYVSVADDQSRGMVIPFVDVYGTSPEANAAHIVKCVNEAEAKDKRIAELEVALENDAARLKSINEKLAGWNDMTGNQRASFREFIWHAECETRAVLAKAGEA